MLTAAEGLAGQSVTLAVAQQQARAALDDWRGRGPIVVFGAGAHTYKILPVLEKYAGKIAGVADDSPQCWGRAVGRWTVGLPAELIDDTVAGILVSSDVQQATLEARLRADFGRRCAILTLYRPTSDGDGGPTLPFTGERQTGRTLAEIELGHRARYYWALQQIDQGANVLDAACGNGYGTYILAEGGLRVLGIDVSEEAVAFARHHYAHAGATFAVGAVDDGVSLRQLATDFATFDAVVSLETLEHVDDPEAFLRSAHELLRPGGALFCSTPNAEAMELADAPYHRQHFTVDATLELLQTAGFPPLAWFGQEGLQILKGRCTPNQRYRLFHAIKGECLRYAL